MTPTYIISHFITRSFARLAMVGGKPGFFHPLAITPGKMYFRTQMSFVCALFRTVACDYHAFGAFATHPSLIEHATFSRYCCALCLIGIVPTSPKSLK